MAQIKPDPIEPDLARIGHHHVPPLPYAQWKQILDPVLGALILSLRPERRNSTYPQDIINDFIAVSHSDTNNPTRATFDIGDDEINAAFEAQAVASLGSVCFGNVYEIYSKHVPGGDVEAILDLMSMPYQNHDRESGSLSDKDVFKSRYPSALVVQWKAEGKSWFVKMVRNAFAHAQWEIFDADPRRLKLWNIKPSKTPGGDRTFDVEMVVSDVRILIYTALWQSLTYARDVSHTNVPTSYDVALRFLRNELMALVGGS